MIYVHWTSANPEEAVEISQALLTLRLIAGGSIQPRTLPMERGLEAIVIFKTQEKHFEKIRKYIEKNCRYLTPDIASKKESPSPNYFKWLIEET